MQHIILLVILVFTTNLFSQNSSLFIPIDVSEAYENGTRTYDGTVSNSYWINHTDYNIDVEFIPDSNLVFGLSKMIYYNNSPDTLNEIVIRLYHNREKPFGDGMIIKSISIRGDSIDVTSQDVRVNGTNMSIKLDEIILPNKKIEMEIDWSFEIPKVPLRMGNYNGDYFIAYWYPQIAVYDDVYGWDKLQYAGPIEFYNDFNNYNIRYTVPADYVIWSTGDLVNEELVFQENIIKKIKEAKNSDKTINIITLDDYANNSVTLKNESGKNIWNYVANKVPDVAWAVSNNYNWDASSIEVEPGRRVLASGVYPDSITQNKNSSLYARKSIKYLSEVSPGVPYPWLHSTAFTNKRSGGGMEFPMIQNNGAPKSIGSSVGLIFHEIAHNYFPFYMGTNERRAAWMDEGWATFFPRNLVEKLDTTSNYQKGRVVSYESLAGKTKDIPMIYPSYMMTHGEMRNNFYNRPAIAYEELRHLLGDELFHKSLREYINRWHEKHPIGYDFFFTFNDVVGEDLSWFWKPWFFELGYPDLAIENVEVNKNSATISVAMVGSLPTRIELTILFEDGKTKTVSASASQLKGQTKVDVKINTSKKIKSIKLGSELIPDINRGNNLFEM